MYRYDPNEWNDVYIRHYEQKCVEVEQMLTAAMVKALQSGDYLSAAQCCDKACAGFSKLAEAISGDKYAPMLYSYSYMLGEITLFGVGTDRNLAGKARQLALAYFEDARDFAESCARPGRRTAGQARKDYEKICYIVSAIKGGYSAMDIWERYCPDFPNDILDNIEIL